SEVRNALRVLARYHEDRWTELLAAAPHLLPRSVSKKKRAYIVGRETQVRDKFNAYSEEMIHLLAYSSAISPWMWRRCMRPSKAGTTSRRALRACSRRPWRRAIRVSHSETRVEAPSCGSRPRRLI